MRDVPAPRYMFYSHDGYGLGHFRRNVVLALAISDLYPEASVLLACSADGLENFSLPSRVDVLRLPGLHKLENGHYVGRRLPVNSSELVSLRGALLASAVEHFRPHVLLADKHPVGVDGELLPALRLLRRQGGRAALGLRDVLDDTERTADEWRRAELSLRIAELHDLVLVYGNSDFLNPLTPGLLPPELEARVRFCGYVVSEAPVSGPAPADLPMRDGRPLVLASAGGGEDGMPLLEAFIETARESAWQGAVVAGPQMEALRWSQLKALAADAGVPAYRSVHQMDRWFAHADALVCMGGYNTLVEAVASGTPTVCVPRVRPRREQFIRARAFADMGLVELVEPETLSPAALADAIDSALRTQRPLLGQRIQAALDLGGSRRAAAYLLELASVARSAPGRPVELNVS